MDCPSPKQYGMIICWEYVPAFVDALANGCLSAFLKKHMKFSNSLEAIDEVDAEERTEILEAHDEELHEAMHSLFTDTWFQTMKCIPTKHRYDLDQNDVLIGIYGSVFLRIRGVLKNSSVLALAIAPCRDSARFIQDVMQGGVTEETFILYGKHWRTTELARKARAGFAALRCDEVRTMDTKMPWDLGSERAKKWMEFPRRPTYWLNVPVDPDTPQEDSKPVVPRRIREAKRRRSDQ